MFQALNTFMKLDFHRKLLFIEAFTFLAIARTLKLLPFATVSKWLGEQHAESAFCHSKETNQLVDDIALAIEVMSRYTFWESKCLVQAIAAMKMLERRRVSSTLYLGVMKEKQGQMAAHAWLRSGSYYVSGADEMERYTVVQTFSKQIIAKESRRGV
ncbi:lasso peptide biosynthesis B2 protein [Halalkalibacter sp. AB-rgal2]|uniref:lasso peptide biosynthesis B2 protein n=1 Tax=Halalkalibacter sp. AB-rgal2 TaxID=3242695 RepID=UPI00359D9053